MSKIGRPEGVSLPTADIVRLEAGPGQALNLCGGGGVVAEPAVGAPKVVVRIGGSAELPAGSLDDATCMTQCRLKHTR